MLMPFIFLWINFIAELTQIQSACKHLLQGTGMVWPDLPATPALTSLCMGHFPHEELKRDKELHMEGAMGQLWAGNSQPKASHPITSPWSSTVSHAQTKYK